MPASHMAPVHVLVTPLPFQVLAKGLGKATEGDPSYLGLYHPHRKTE